MQSLIEARKPLPTLMVMGDVAATRNRLIGAAERAVAGDNDAAIALGRITQNALIVSSTSDDKAQVLRKEQIPPNVRDESLYWLGMAADRGDSVAQLMYSNAVMSVARWKDRANLAVDQQALALAESRALAHLQAAVAAGVVDGLKMLAAAYQEGLLGLAHDAAKAHAALIRLEAKLPNPETRQLVSASQAKLPLGDLTRAQALAARATWRVGS